MAEQQRVGNSKKINLTIITPRGVKYVEQADMVVMRTIDGDLGIMPGHEPISTVLGDGILRIKNDGVEKKLAVFGGTVEVDPISVTILSTIAQLPEEIDLERAENDRREAEAMLEEASEELRLHSSQVLLRRSLVRIEVNLHLEESQYNDQDE